MLGKPAHRKLDTVGGVIFTTLWPLTRKTSETSMAASCDQTALGAFWTAIAREKSCRSARWEGPSECERGSAIWCKGPESRDHPGHYGQQVPLNWSFVAQDILWKDYASGALDVGNGISAMPSLHVGGATLCALLGCRTNKRLGIALSAYAVILMIGSVHLGWHYAIDGYVAPAPRPCEASPDDRFPLAQG